jgi:hypothetical protein
MFGTVLMAGLSLWALLGWQLKSGWMPLPRRMAVVAAVIALWTLVLLFFPRGYFIQSEDVSIHNAKVRLLDQERPRLELRTTVTQVDTEEHWFWSIQKLELDGQKVPVWNRLVSEPSGHTFVSGGGSIQWSLAVLIAGDLGQGYLLEGDVLPPGRGVLSWVSQNLTGTSLHEGDEHEVAIHLKGRAYLWEKAAEMPLAEGAQDAGWTLVQDTLRRAHAHSAATEAGASPSRGLSLHYRQSRRFLEDFPQNPPFYFVLVDDENRIVEIARHGHCAARMGGGALNWLGYRVEFRHRLHSRGSLNKARLCIYRLVEVNSIASTWQGNVEVEGPPGPGQRLADRKGEKEPEDVNEWMKRNPPPALNANEREVRTYLAELLGQLNSLKKYLPMQHPAIDWLTLVVSQQKQGTELLLRAREALAGNDHYARHAIDSALAAGFSRGDLALLTEVQAVLNEAAKRGWLLDVKEDLIDRAGEGEYEAIKHLMTLPDYGGMTENDFFEVFLRKPDPDFYRLLREDERLKVRMDAQIREWFETIPPSIDLPGGETGFPMELALAAGFPDAPERLHRLITWVGVESLSIGSMHITLDRYFADRHWPPGGWEAFFIKQNPADFEFDEESGKYRLKGDLQ